MQNLTNLHMASKNNSNFLRDNNKDGRELHERRIIRTSKYR